MINIEAAFFSLGTRIEELENDICYCRLHPDITEVVVNSMDSYMAYGLEDRIRKMQYYIGKIAELLKSDSSRLRRCKKNYLTEEGFEERLFNNDEKKERWKLIKEELTTYHVQLVNFAERDMYELTSQRSDIPNIRRLMLDKNVTVKALSVLLSAVLEDILYPTDRVHTSSKAGQLIVNHFCLYGKRGDQVNLKNASHPQLLKDDYEDALAILTSAMNKVKERQKKDPD